MMKAWTPKEEKYWMQPIMVRRMDWHDLWQSIRNKSKRISHLESVVENLQKRIEIMEWEQKLKQ